MPFVEVARTNAFEVMSCTIFGAPENLVCGTPKGVLRPQTWDNSKHILIAYIHKNIYIYILKHRRFG